MTVKEIVKKYLEENGFDGLCCDRCSGCALGDLMNCDLGKPDCKPGYGHDCDECDMQDCCGNEGFGIPNGWCICEEEQ